jgi:mono/diheme cytochrome c family protein
VRHDLDGRVDGSENSHPIVGELPLSRLGDEHFRVLTLFRPIDVSSEFQRLGNDVWSFGASRPMRSARVGEDWRVTSRFCLALLIGSLTLALSGCSDSFNAGPLRYVVNEKLRTDLKGKPKLQSAVLNGLAKLFGEDPQHIRVPEGMPLPAGGIQLANYREVGKDTRPKPISVQRQGEGGKTVVEPQEGGYALYRRHCLHCHGVSGAGDGPTADFLYPRPRDYRKGLYKFTSTSTGAKPTREDLRKTIVHGLHGTSMPAFEAQMSEPEIEQVIDYVIFLSIRGETEQALIEEASVADENDAQALSDEVLAEIAKSVINKWKAADGQVLNPPIPRTPMSRESVIRGRDLFLGLNSKTGTKEVDCTSCHGPLAKGDGPSFVAQSVFNDVVFSGSPSGMGERLARYDKATLDLWKQSLDDWGNPLRPANLNRSVYKGGRRPIDLYWRIAKGINGAKMPGHFPAIGPEKIWDLVNFVLALPYDPMLVEGVTLPETPSTPPKPAVARR